jgi:hypothetical protein
VKKQFLFLVMLALIVVCFSCDGLLGGASPSPSATPSALPAISWTEVGSANGPVFALDFNHYGGVYQRCAFGVDAQGQLHIIGIIADSNATGTGRQVFTLPAGFRPTTLQRAVVTGYAAGANFPTPLVANLEVRIDGTVWITPSNASSDDTYDLGHVVVTLR